MNYKKILRVALLILPLCNLAVSCTTYDYDEELNDAEQQRIRLHQEDQKIYEEITEASHSLDYLIGEMSARVRGELATKEANLLQAIAEGEGLVRQYLDGKLGDADAYVDGYDRQMRELMQQKEGEFNQACATLQQQLTDLADQGYNTNVQKMQEGIDLLNNFQSMYDDAVGKMRDRIEALQNMEQRMSALEQQLLQNQQKRDQILQRVSTLQQNMQTLIIESITSTKTSEEHTAALRELQDSYSELVTSMKQLNDAYDYDDSWVNEAESYAQTVQGAIDDIEGAINKAKELNTLLEQFEAGKTDDLRTALEEIRGNMEDLSNYDSSLLDEAQDAADKLQDLCDEINTAAQNCSDYVDRCEDAYNNSDWESWKS